MLSSLFFMAGCSILSSLTGDPSKQIADAEAKMKAGDLAGAAAIYDEALKKSPTNLDVASGAAYLKLLQGNTQAADQILAATEGTAGEKLAEVKMRRALVAMRTGDLDQVKAHAAAAGTPLGKLLAAEVNLADGDRDAAKALLEEVKAAGGPAGDTASAYLDLMNDSNPLVAGLSEAQALWALGQRPIAVRSVEDLVKAYAGAREDGAEQLLVWAGRAVSVGEPGIAENLLDAIPVAPPGQVWRVQATRAMIACAGGDGDAGLAGFDRIVTISPADGYADARATAAILIADRDAETARKLLEGQSTDAAARAWAILGDPGTAGTVAMDPVFKAQFTATAGG
ncbi:MAG: tetratricopeptide repeat protein [Deltaproteobacteria bacterium]|nr:tetratricopeptide repeat protein [Deltaproteobacteria bacterium]